jgi:hypothetical protein
MRHESARFYHHRTRKCMPPRQLRLDIQPKSVPARVGALIPYGQVSNRAKCEVAIRFNMFQRPAL